jgi:hypothetical protein
MTTNNDQRCFINCDGEIKFVKDLPIGSYQIDASFQRNNAIFIDILEDDCGEKLVLDTYDLHDSIEVLQKVLNEI